MQYPKTLPRVSVITVVFNARALLEQTIHAIDRLNYPDIEHVIVDGGSTDGTVDLLSMKRNVATVSISEGDNGIYHAMNKGIQMSTGDYLWFINAGDAPASPDVLEALTRIDNVDVLYGDTNLIGSNQHLVKLAQAPSSLSWQTMAKGMYVSHQSIVIRRNLAPLYDLDYMYIADQKWIVESLRGAQCCRYIHQPMSNYLMGGLSERHFFKFLNEKIAYSFNELSPAFAVAVTVKDLVGAVRFYLSAAIRKIRARV